jgi:diguanylate cyclase (GGDEF)-like protein
MHEKRLDFGDGRQARDIVVHLAALKTEEGVVEGVVGAIIDVTEERALRAHLEDLAATDPLTGAFNRRAFTERALAEMERCKRPGLPLSMILFDLDFFKQVNDTNGHQAGDAVLKAVTVLFQDSLRQPTDFLGRMGGEEFAIMAVDCGIDDAMALAERLRRKLEQSPVPWGQSRLPLTASFGVTQVTGNGQTGLDIAMRQADKALYAAKESGRNRVFRWSHADDRAVMVAA